MYKIPILFTFNIYRYQQTSENSFLLQRKNIVKGNLENLKSTILWVTCIFKLVMFYIAPVKQIINIYIVEYSINVFISSIRIFLKKGKSFVYTSFSLFSKAENIFFELFQIMLSTFPLASFRETMTRYNNVSLCYQPLTR